MQRSFLLLSLLLCPAILNADHPVVPAFERFHTDDKADPVRGGQLLLGALNCTGCHASTNPNLFKHPAPVLDAVGTRVRLSHLRKFLADPQAVKPGTTMPALFAGDPERAQKVEALVHFLSTTGTLRHERADSKGVAPGRDVYHKAGCVACHGSRDAVGNADKVFATSIPLGDLKAKYSLAGLSALLTEPHQVRPSGRMPRLLQPKEAKDVANYLLQGIKVELPSGRGTTTFAYYEGNWDKVPDFAKMKRKPQASGTAAAFDVGVARRGSDYGILFEGFFRLERDGDCKFSLHSDDGSLLWVDGKQVVNNDGIHPPQTSNGSVKLTKGVHKVTVGFIQGGGGAELSVSLDGPGFAGVDLGALIAATEADLDKKPVVKETSEDLLEFKPELIKKGRELFASVGCASCHQLREGQKPIASTLIAMPLDRLTGTNGCLNGGKGLPSFNLSAAQKTALARAVKTPSIADSSPQTVIARTFTAFNCYACHARDKIGGVEEDLNKFFLSAQPEMGDEGRLPPALDGVGAKITLDYLKNALDKGMHDRPYMHTRMPGFGLANVGQLVEAFTKLDKLPELKAVTFAEPMGRIKTTGRHLVGSDAFGCVKCHTFNGQKAEGVQGIDMTLLPKKLRHDWFHAYINDPQRFRPGTRMPSAFADGKSTLPKILDGTATTQIEAMWVYLADGANARLPVGVGNKKSIPLVPTTSAILYRNFISGSGNRAIAVGYPEKAHLSFDANEMRLALIWRGAFIDAAKHWTDRGAGSEGPLGDDVVALHGGVPFAVLSKTDEAWPKEPAKDQGYRFLGYKLTPDDRPTFLYAQGELRVEDFPNAVAGKEPTLKRELAVTASKQMDNVHYRAAVGNKIEAQADGWYRIDGLLRVKVDNARVRQSGGKAELLVPLKPSAEPARIALEYAW